MPVSTLQDEKQNPKAGSIIRRLHGTNRVKSVHSGNKEVSGYLGNHESYHAVDKPERSNDPDHIGGGNARLWVLHDGHRP